MDKEHIEQSVKLINDYILAYNRFDIKAISALLTDDVEYKKISHGELTNSTDGIVEFSLLQEQSKAMFSKREQKILNINLGTNTANVDIEFNATLAVGTVDGLKAGQEISFKGTTSFNFKDGKIAKIHDVS